MGLDTTHNAWHGPYGIFNDFRTKIAKVALGIDYDEMNGLGGSKPWEPYRKHDLFELLIHSDCDGHLTVSQCKKIARGLKAIQWPEGTEQWYIEKTNQFIKGCELAISQNKKIEFH